MDASGPQSSSLATSSPPPKPWERASSSSGPAPFKPSAPGRTSDVVEASGTAKPGEVVSTSNRNDGVNTNAVGRPLPTRPWENNYGGSSYGGYNSGLNYGSGLSSGLYNSYGQGYGGMYGGGAYGNSMSRGMYGGGLYGSGMYGSGMYGGGMYNNSFGGPMGGYGMGMGGGPYGGQDPNNPYGAPSAPPGFWISFLRVMEGVVNFFGRISILIDQNTQAVHFFMSALLQLFDRGGVLYGELARFVMRLLGVRAKRRKIQDQGPNGAPLPGLPGQEQRYLEGPKPAPGESWDNVWGTR